MASPTSTSLLLLLAIKIHIHSAFDTYCDEPSVCSGTISNNWIFSGGYRSVDPMSTALAASHIYGSGDRSFMQSTLVAGFQDNSDKGIIISGALGAYNSYMECEDDIIISAAYGAASSQIIAKTTLTCSAHSACRNSKIFANNIISSGAFSLANGTIERNPATDSETMNITFSGMYSGYKAKIICPDGFVCSITCSVHACWEMNCIGDGCNVNGLTMPLLPSAFAYDALVSLTLAEDACNSDMNAMTYDIYQEQSYGDKLVSNSTICCRGKINILILKN